MIRSGYSLSWHICRTKPFLLWIGQVPGCWNSYIWGKNFKNVLYIVIYSRYVSLIVFVFDVFSVGLSICLVVVSMPCFVLSVVSVSLSLLSHTREAYNNTGLINVLCLISIFYVFTNIFSLKYTVIMLCSYEIY